MKTWTPAVSLLALASLAAGLTLAPQPTSFILKPAKSQFAWAATTNQGAITGASQSFALAGTLDLDLQSSGQSSHTGRFVNASTAILPDITGGFAGGPSGAFALVNGRISLSSGTFAIAPDGSFSTLVTPTFLDGDLQVAPPFGPSGSLILDGRDLEPILVDGQFRPSGSVLWLRVPLDLQFNFSLGGVGGTLDMPGVLIAGVRRPHHD